MDVDLGCSRSRCRRHLMQKWFPQQVRGLGASSASLVMTAGRRAAARSCPEGRFKGQLTGEEVLGWKLYVSDTYRSGLFSSTVFCHRITSFTRQGDTRPMKNLLEYQSRCVSAVAESTGRAHLLRRRGECVLMLLSRGRKACWVRGGSWNLFSVLGAG